MTAKTLLILPAALLCLAAQPAPKTAPPAKAAPAKAAPAKPASSRPTAAKPAPPASPFDAQNPQGLMELLGAAGAQAQTKGREDDSVFVTVTSTAASFSMQFAGCTPQGRACRAVLLDAVMERSAASSAQINAFNQTSVMCRVYQDRAGLAHILYSALLFKTMTRDDATSHLGAWQGCLADGRDFLRDPVAYLANAA